MAENKDQHYLPAFYLYNFTNATQRCETQGKEKRETKIYHYDFNKRRVLQRPIRKVATESYLYSYKNKDGMYNHTCDDQLQLIENKAAISFKYFDNILQYIIKHKKTFIEIDNQYIDNIIDLLCWQIKRHPDTIAYLENKYEQLLCNNRVSGDHAKQKALEAVMNIGMDNEFNLRREFDKKNKWIVFTSSPERNFITTDKPFVRYNPHGTIGIAINDTEMYYPLTSNMMLWMHNNGSQRGFKVENDRPYLRLLNSYIAKHATRYVFGTSSEYIVKIVRMGRLLSNCNIDRINTVNLDKGENVSTKEEQKEVTPKTF